MYAITGATGNIGSKVANLLLAKGERIRVIGRNWEKLQTFVDRGAEAAVGDMRKAGFLNNAFAGVDAVFAMIPPNLETNDFREYQAEIGEAIAEAIMNNGVRFGVNLSSQGAELAEGTGPIAGLHDQEERLDRLHGLNVVHLRPAYFMENLLASIPLIATQGIAGSALRGDLPFAMIATRDIAAEVTELLVNRNFQGISVKDLLGERDLSMNEAFAVIGRRIAIPELKYVQFPYDEAVKGMKAMGISENVACLYIEMSNALNNRMIGVNKARNAANTTVTSIEEFAGVFAEAWSAYILPKAA